MTNGELTEFVLTRLYYSYRIKCKNCDTWQDFNSVLPKNDMKVRYRLKRWTCRMCSYENLIAYELGLNIIDD